MNRSIFTSLIIVQLLISIHSDIHDEDTNAYYEIYDEAFRPIVTMREADGIMDDGIKKTLGPSVVKLAASATVKYYYYGNLLNTFEKRVYAELWKICQKPVKTFTTEWIDVSQYKVLTSKLGDSSSKAATALTFNYRILVAQC